MKYIRKCFDLTIIRFLENKFILFGNILLLLFSTNVMISYETTSTYSHPCILLSVSLIMCHYLYTAWGQMYHDQNREKKVEEARLLDTCHKKSKA